MTEPAGWKRVMAAASEVSPAVQWRTTLAQRLLTAARAKYVTVVTCPPWQYLAAQASTAPVELEPVTEELFVRFLPRIEQTTEGMKLVAAMGMKAYAPLDRVVDRALAVELKKELLGPIGVHTMLNAFMLGSDNGPIGWIAIGLPQGNARWLQQVGELVEQTATAASLTLRSAMALAEGCGVQLPKIDLGPLSTLSERERQVVRLVVTGLTDENVAQRLSLSESTVGVHLKRVYRRLGVHSRVELAARFGPALGARDTVVNSASR